MVINILKKISLLFFFLSPIKFFLFLMMKRGMGTFFYVSRYTGRKVYKSRKVRWIVIILNFLNNNDAQANQQQQGGWVM